ncbi:MAG: WcbI family polysaccharide biosynthesis putative acetyltransferase [Acetobacteraceae bacterium]
MHERLEVAFVFGTLGNLSGALGEGWSVEDHYAWAIGAESRLNLPLPGDATRYLLRFTVQPLVNAGLCDTQRLDIDTVSGLLASFSIDRRTTIELALPIEQTRDNRSIELILRHPDALRPSDFKRTDDRRLLSLCFMSGTLVRQLDDAREPPAETAPGCHLIVAGNHLARQMAEVMSALPILRQRVACHFVNTDQGRGAAPPPTEALQSAALCWEQSGGNNGAEWSGLRGMLPADCDVRRFAAPRMKALWPFLDADPRLVFEAGLYPGGRYPYGDRIGASLAYLQLPDDIMQLSYQSMTEKEMPDLDALFAADRAAWRQLDATHDVKVAEFIVENFRRYRLFFAPPDPTGDLLRHMIMQLVTGSPIEALCDPAKLRRELDFLLTGYLGRREELPIHPHVARRFGLAWWQPGMRYRWHSNHWTFEEHALRYIRWTPWRP